jgi:hypothetical protein
MKVYKYKEKKTNQKYKLNRFRWWNQRTASFQIFKCSQIKENQKII